MLQLTHTMSHKITGLPFTGKLVGISSCGKCDYFSIDGKDEEYFVTTQFYSFLCLPVSPVYPLRQFIGTATEDSKIKVSAVLGSCCVKSIFWTYLRVFFIVGFVVTFISTSTALNKWAYQEGTECPYLCGTNGQQDLSNLDSVGHNNLPGVVLMWIVLILYTWISVVLGVFYKPEASKKDRDKYRQFVLEQEGTDIAEVFSQKESRTNEATQAPDIPDGRPNEPVFWIILRTSLVLICLVTFVIALVLTLHFKSESLQLEIWWKYLIVWAAFLIAGWCGVFFGIILKSDRKKTADRRKRLRQGLVNSGRTNFGSDEADQPVPTENVEVQLGAEASEVTPLHPKGGSTDSDICNSCKEF